MPLLGDLYKVYVPRIRRLPKSRPLADADLAIDAFRVETHGELEIYYAPMDWLRPNARVAIVGITPGRDTMRIAYQVALHGFAAGDSVAKVFDDVKSQATFSGFRSLLLYWLDWLRVPYYLGVESAAVLWAERQELVHPTSVIRYPVFVRGKNYSGSSPRLTRHPAFRRYLREVLAPELARLPEAVVVPLGEKVSGALQELAAEALIDPARCLLGFPHPSGANGLRMVRWEENRELLRRKVGRWFKAHPPQ